MADYGVLYLSIGMKHAARLAVSLYSLRRHYPGAVAVLTDEPNGVAAGIANDPHVRASVVDVPDFRRRRSACYLFKTELHRRTPFPYTLFLDADTLVCGSLYNLWPRAAGEVVLTDFATGRWFSNRRPIRGRLARWRKVAPELVRRAWRDGDEKAQGDRAVNTGVFAFGPACADLFDPWHELTAQMPSFMCDELTMQLLYPTWGGRVAVLDDRYNASPLYKSCDEPIIWHGHGGKSLRGAMRGVWLTTFWECYDRDVGGVRRWIPRAEFLRYKGE